MRHKINFSLLLSLVTWLAIFSVQTSAQELGDVDNLEQPDWLHSVTLKLENTDSDSADDTVESSTKVMGEREILGERFGLWYRWQNRERRSWNLQPKFSGWTSVGYHDQNNGLFNNHAHGINLHQLWMTIESSSVKEGDDQSVIGYRMDVVCLLYTSPSPRDAHESRMPSSA